MKMKLVLEKIKIAELTQNQLEKIHGGGPGDNHKTRGLGLCRPKQRPTAKCDQ